MPTEELIPLAEKLLEVPSALMRTALDLELSDGTVIADHVGETPCAFLVFTKPSVVSTTGSCGS